MSEITTEVVDGRAYEVQTEPDGTIIRTDLGPVADPEAADKFAAFAEALAEALADDEVTAREAIATALAAVG